MYFFRSATREDFVFEQRAILMKCADFVGFTGKRNGGYIIPLFNVNQVNIACEMISGT